MRELTPKERRAIHKLVLSTCANYDHEYGCLPLDGTCYMFTIAYNTSSLCRHFRDILLRHDPALEVLFTGQQAKACEGCGRKFPVNGRQAYCSKPCADTARRMATAARVRRHRNVTGQM
jgi:hypothetical protein